MTMKRHYPWLILLVVVLVVSVFMGYRAWQAHSDAKLIAGLLKVGTLPRGTRVVAIHKDFLPNTVVIADLLMPAGTVTNLLRGLPFEPTKAKELGEKRNGAPIKCSWGCRFKNAHFNIDCDVTETKVHVECAVD